MNVLIVSDDPERESFRQISMLKNDIEGITTKRIDLVAFSTSGVFLNQKLIAKKPNESEILATLENVLKRKEYSIFIISLGLRFLKQLFPDESNILDLVNKTSPEATVFIFGANCVIKTIRQKKHVFKYPRRGVAKLTQEFKNSIISHVRSQT